MKTLLQVFQPERGTGANIDLRPVEEKLKDYKFEEVVASVNPVQWVEKPQSQWRKFPIFNQNGSGSCVAQTLAKLLGILYYLKNGTYVHFSATHIYQRRPNKPAGGMNGVDAFNIARLGVTLEDLVPSQEMTDEQMDRVKVEDYKEKVGEVFKIGNYLVVPTKDIDTVASIIQTTGGKGVMVWFYFTIDEWTPHPVVKDGTLPLEGGATARHSVAAVDYTLVNGKKAIIIEDSWGTSYGMAGQRVIDEDFFKARNWFVAYPMNFAFEEGQPSSQKPHYNFQHVMSFTPAFTYNADVVELQNVLKYEGLFPKNTDSTGYYGALTAKAVLAFQKKYKIASDTELSQLQGRVVGIKTLAKLNQLYGVGSTPTQTFSSGGSTGGSTLQG